MQTTRLDDADALDALDRRAHGVADRARAALDDGHDAVLVPPDAIGHALGEACAELHEALRAYAADDLDRAATLCETLAELTALQRELSEHVVELRFRSLARIHEGLTRLRAETSVAALLRAAPEELCRCCTFDRAVVSRVQGATWQAEVVYIGDGQDPELSAATTDFLLGTSLPLEPEMLETQMVRRRAAALITDPAGDPRVHRPLVQASGTLGYVAAPVMPTGRVIGFLHADCHGTGSRELGELDRDNIWTFAEGFGLIFERLVLFDRLGEQRAAAREAFEKAERQLDELYASEVKLARHEHEVSQTASTAAALFGGPTSRVERLLTDREREVMSLMVTGARNSEIADQLVITQDTVKSHVKKILRKLRASSRAEAVSRYLQLTMRERP